MQLKPILVTGSHRSGTTWIGRTLAVCPDVFYVKEPFNPSQPGGAALCNLKFSHWYTYICSENEAAYIAPLCQTIGLRYDLRKGFSECRGIADLRRSLSEYSQARRCRALQGVPLLKDPIALFSAVWLASTFEMNVLVMIRHPAAFVGSIKERNWRFDLTNFLNQPLLMRDLIPEYEDEIREFVRSGGNIIDESILVWRILHSVILKYQETQADWLFLRHEDISLNPESHFAKIFRSFSLDFSPAVARYIRESTRAEDTATKDTHPQNVFRDSSANVRKWKMLLKPSELSCIRERVCDISDRYYSSDDW